MSTSKPKLLLLSVTVFFAVISISNVSAQNNYQSEIGKWRETHETDLKSDNSWLTLTGLFWLKEGTNMFGSATGNDVVLPASTAMQTGIIEFKQEIATLRLMKTLMCSATEKVFAQSN